ncbi:MAG TPA: thioredoxin domain-containing protein [Gemmatimonadaceae bacterium]|nr:thioredoxin domain-containing protein [Gemmatimonadaceae bacterium]
MPNRLASESSPYLRQHADNPVDWYPWGPEALGRAREEQKPILLSIGYAACHWCHVMAHESFENAETAALMNARFINIKVDREERPDLDGIYMQAVQAMTGHGGWPMTVFLTPDGEPFGGGTYFPPDERMGMPSFRRVLSAVADSYASRPEQIARTVATMRDLYATTARTVPGGAITRETLSRAFQGALRTFDTTNGGFGHAPKFPPTMLLSFLLRHWARTGDARALAIAHDTFAKMSAGGIHDHVGGGFHRYAVDAVWLVPHFEKMLYDNALLAKYGAELWQATHDPAVRTTTERVLRWLTREMTSPQGGFYSSLDADSEGHEGAFYLWSASDFDRALGKDAAVAREWYGVTDGGNFEGSNILHRPADASVSTPPHVARIRAHLYSVRSRREWPGLDDKIVAAWNGLALRGVATCARIFSDEEWLELALRNATFLAEHVHGDSVTRILAPGRTTRGFLEDHAAVALGFLDVWQLTHDRAWLDRARTLAGGVLAHFWDDAAGAFYDVPAGHEALITRPRDQYDNATPSGSSLAAELLLQLAYVTGDGALARKAETAAAALAEPLARHPHAFGHWLTTADAMVHGYSAVSIVGSANGARTLLDVANAAFLPSALVTANVDGSQDGVAVFAGRDARGGPAAAYVCRGPVCDAPALTGPDLEQQLQRMQDPVPARTES